MNRQKLTSNLINAANVLKKSFVSFQTIIQDGKQYKAEYNSNYPDINTSIKPGVSSESIIIYKGVKQSDFKYTFDGYDSEYNDMKFNFDIKIK